MTLTVGSILLGSADAERLRDWYCTALSVRPNADGFLELGGVAVLIDGRDDVAPKNAEPGRTILNFHVDDARALAAHLDTLGVTWIAELEPRDDVGLFATLEDPDGNYVQIIELTAEYLARQR